MVDRALCFSLSGNPLTLQQTRFFTCNDSSATTCGGAAEVASSALCAVDPALAGAQQLLVCAGDTADTGVECSVPLADLGWSSGQIVLMRGCTYNSAQPNSSSSDCIVDGSSPFIIDPVTGGNTPVTLQELSIE